MNSPAIKAQSPPPWTQCESKDYEVSVRLLNRFAPFGKHERCVRRTRGGTPHSAEFIPAAMRGLYPARMDKISLT